MFLFSEALQKFRVTIAKIAHTNNKTIKQSGQWQSSWQELTNLFAQISMMSIFGQREITRKFSETSLNDTLDLMASANRIARQLPLGNASFRIKSQVK